MELALTTLISWVVGIIASRNGQPSSLAAGITVCIVLLPLELARQLDIDIIARVRAALRHETRDDSWVQPILNAIEQAAASQSSVNNSFLQVASIIEKYERAQTAEASRQSEALHELLGALNARREELSSLPSRIATPTKQEYFVEDFSQHAINRGQVEINFLLTVVNEKTRAALEQLEAAVQKLANNEEVDVKALKDTIDAVHEANQKIAGPFPPGCDPRLVGKSNPD